MNHRAAVLSCSVAFALACSMAGAKAARAEGTATGSVVAADGKPVEGAEVIVATPELPAWPNLSVEQRYDEEAGDARRGAATATTDKAGRFTVELPEGAGVISVAHPKLGYATVKPEALREKSDPIKLDPWCRIEGTVKVGVKPAAAGTKVTLGVFYAHGDASAVHYGYDAATDDAGRYVLDRVPAGLNQVRVKPSATGSPLAQYVGVGPDKPARLDVGSRGRPVIGKLVLSGVDVKEISNLDGKKRLVTQSHFRRDVPWPKPPYFDPSADTAQEREDILTAWRRTPEAVEQWKNQYRHDVEFQPDGSYRFDDVPPGKYFLTLNVYAREGDGPNSRSIKMVANQRIEVNVPETPAVPTDEPLDLGEQKFETTPLSSEGL